MLGNTVTEPSTITVFRTFFIIKLADRYCNVNDFMLTKPAYAKEYFEKAAVVISAARSRAAEIAQFFGKETAAMILADYENLTTVLVTVGS